MSGKSKLDGAPVGSGRPRKERKPLKAKAKAPLKFLMEVMRDEDAEPALRVRAAITVAQYMHTKRADGGKKEEREQAAKAAGAGKFRPAAPPKLAIVKSA